MLSGATKVVGMATSRGSIVRRMRYEHKTNRSPSKAFFTVSSQEDFPLNESVVMYLNPPQTTMKTAAAAARAMTKLNVDWR